MFKLKTMALVILTLMFTVKSYAATFDDAKQTFNNYDKEITNLQKSIDMFDRIIKENKDPQTVYQAYYNKAHAYLIMGDQSKLTHTDALKDYETGKAIALKAMKTNPKGAMGYFWYAANLGRVAQLKGVLNSLFMLPDFKKYLGKAYKLAPKNQQILEAYGEMYFDLPWIAGGSNSKAIEYLRKSLKSDPNFTLSMVIMGKIYISEDKYDKAKKILEKAINYKTPTYRADWAMYDKPLAQKLLKSIKDKLKD